MAAMTERDVDLFLDFVQKERFIDLSFYRKTFLGRRITIRMDAVGVQDIQAYINTLRKDNGEWLKFIDNLSINVSEFFRDPEVYDCFTEKCVKPLIDKKEKLKSRFIRCWSCGCSHGEEPYSLAIIFRECLGVQVDKFMLRIIATDVDADALQKAYEGKYTKQSLAKVRAGLLCSYFDALDNGVYQVKEEIKQFVSFKKHNLLTDGPLSDMDVVFFRNVRIYFSEHKVEKILFNIYNSLKKDGYLVVGRVETVGSLKGLFEPVSLNNKIFRKV